MLPQVYMHLFAGWVNWSEGDMADAPQAGHHFRRRSYSVHEHRRSQHSLGSTRNSMHESAHPDRAHTERDEAQNRLHDAVVVDAAVFTEPQVKVLQDLDVRRASGDSVQ